MINNRQMQMYRIPQELLLELVTGRARMKLPEGAELGGVWIDPVAETVLLRVHHPSFARVSEGCQVIIGELQVERWTALP